MRKKVNSPPELSKVVLASSESQATFNDWWYHVSSQEHAQFETFLQKMDSFSRYCSLSHTLPLQSAHKPNRSPSMNNLPSLYRSNPETRVRSGITKRRVPTSN